MANKVAYWLGTIVNVNSGLVFGFPNGWSII